ncbi:hypothetical protein GQ457_15G016470 [Hibiscus cannabinus]
MVWIRLPGLSYRYFCKALFWQIAQVVGRVVKVDYNTQVEERGKFARLDVMVHLNKPLKPCIGIDNFIQNLEYEGLQQICFKCGVYVHAQEVCSVGRETADMETSEKVEVEALNIDKDGFYGPWVVAKSRRKVYQNLDSKGRSGGLEEHASGSRFADVSKKGKEQSFVRRQHVLRKGVRVEGGSKIDGDSSHSNAKPKAGLVGFKAGKENVLYNLKIRNRLESRSFEKVELSEWANSVSNQFKEVLNQGHNKQALGVRGFDKDDPGDSRTPRTGNAMEERPAAVGINVDAEIGMRAVASSKFRRHFKNVHKQKGARIDVLLEPRISGRSADMVIRMLGFDNSFHIEAHAFSGNIWLLWMDEFVIEIMKACNQFIHCRCRSVRDSEWCFITVIYASPTTDIRRLVWVPLSDLNPGDGVSWLLGGDFNAITNSGERFGGSANSSGISKFFSESIEGSGLLDMSFVGNQYTWHHVSDANQYWARLIRAKHRWESIDARPVLRSRCSHLWKSIRLVWSTVKSNVVWQLSDGRRVKFWTDWWIDNDNLLVDKIINGQRPCFPDALVTEKIDRFGQWRWELLERVLPCDIFFSVSRL